MTRDGSDSVWVTSEVDPDGTYFAAVSYGDDLIFRLTRETAVAYGMALLTVVAEAVHDAALVGLCRETGMAVELAAWMREQVKTDRVPVDQSACGPFRFSAMVSAATGLPWVILSLNGAGFSQWTPNAARLHAAHVMTAPYEADLDAAAYVQFRMSVAHEDAQAAVMAMGGHRRDNHDGRAI